MNSNLHLLFLGSRPACEQMVPDSADSVDMDEDFHSSMDFEVCEPGATYTAETRWKQLGQHLAEGTLYPQKPISRPPSSRAPHVGWRVVSQRFLDGTLVPRRRELRRPIEDGWGMVSKLILDGTFRSTIDDHNTPEPEVDSPSIVPFLQDDIFVDDSAESRLGAGAFGVVRVGRTTNAALPESVAVKMSRTTDCAGFKHEAEIAWYLQHTCDGHENVVTLFGLCHVVDKLSLVYELCDGSLAGFLRRFVNPSGLQTVPPEIVYDVSEQIAAGMDYVHSQGVIHLDLKPENLLVKRPVDLMYEQDWPEGSLVLITDFEHAMIDSTHDNSCIEFHGKGTPYYMAPEAITQRRCSPESDVWAFAIIEWQLLTGRKMYTNPQGHEKVFQDPMAVLYSVGMRNTPPMFDWPYPFSEFLPAAFSYNDDARPSFADIVYILRASEHDFCQSDSSSLEDLQLAWWHSSGRPYTGHFHE
mmetsp:Transcript_43942/g.61067  ORF Transcript_43942/g.61067 Transcript_43942/m.61067 type:complete len:470 (+) Transcript_43942:63-1472(+)